VAIIYTYPTKAAPNVNDLILISDSEDNNKTKQVTIASLPGVSSAGVSSVTSANAAITVADTTTTPVLTSVAYSGGTGIGHVPTGSGSSSAVYLDGTGSWSTPSGGGDLAIEDEGTQIADAATTIDFTGAGVTASGDNTKVTVNVPPRLNHGFSPFPIYQGNGTITIAAGGSLAIAAQTICDIAAGQLTVTRVFGDLPEECTINVAVYTGSLTFQGGTSLAYFANKTLDATDATNQIHAVTEAVGQRNNWVPAAGTPISIIIEIDNSSGTTDAVLLGSATASNFSNTLAFEVQPPQGSTSIFNPTATNPNTTLGKQVNTILNYSARSATAKRVCNHYDPF
jgi:hypothetical protein